MAMPPRPQKEAAPRSMTGRTIAITLVALVLGGYVLNKGFHKPAKISTGTAAPTATVAPGGAAKPTSTIKGATTAASGASVTTAPVIVAPTTVPVNASVALLVANGAEKAGIAGRVSAVLQTKGYTGVMAPPTNTLAVVSTSTVYFTAGNDRVAAVVAKDLKIATVTAMPPTAPVKELRNAGVLVALGTDFDENAVPKDNALKGTTGVAAPAVTAATVATVPAVSTAITTPAVKAVTTTVKK